MKKLIVASITLLILTACASVSGPRAVANLAPTSGSTASGTVRFVELADGGVRVTVDLTGVPEGVHGFHVHEVGDCGDNGNAAGGHFNPGGHPHGAPGAVAHHAGDFGNVTADPRGIVKAEFTATSIRVSGGSNSVVGRSVILHANPDDLTSQPTGNAGGRIACGLVRQE